MGLRHWLRSRLLESDAEGNDVPPGSSILHALLGREEERQRALGEYDSRSYPADLSELLQRRAEVAAELLSFDVTSREARIESIPRLQQLLRKYPHPLGYEMLIHAYLDAGRFDEAKGVAFAARERRLECARSPYPEIRSETDRLREWSSSDIEDLRAEYEARQARVTQ